MEPIKNCVRYAAAVALICLAPSHGFCAADSAQQVNKEAFLIRRIAEFWKDGDFGIVKNQIHSFLEQYPKSSLSDYLWGILGDLHLQEGAFSDALSAYDKVNSSEIYQKILLNKLQSYYENGDYAALADEGREYLDSDIDFGDRENEYTFLMAEGYYRQISTESDEVLAKGLAHRAMPLYESLIGTDYDKSASFALAETYRILGQHEKGADLYNMLADKYPNKEELLMFNAALLQVDYNRKKAIELFDKVIEKEGEKEGDARYNRLLLYFQESDYAKVAEEHLAVYPHVRDEHIPSFHFIVAKCYYLLEQPENALVSLKKYLLSEPTNGNQHKDALLIGMSVAGQLTDETLFSDCLGQFEEKYPEDDQLGKAFFLKAMLCKQQDDYEAAEENLGLAFERLSSFDDKENLIYEIGVVAHHNEQWEKSYETFKTFINEYPETDRSESAWRHYLSAAIHLSRESDNYSKTAFLGDLSNVLQNGDGLTDEETREYRLLFAKMAYETESYDKALEALTVYIENYPGHESVAEAHLLTALCLNRLQGNLKAFCGHLETAIQLNPATYDNINVHLQLFNGYLSMSEQEKDAELLDKAADHLYTAFQADKDLIQTTNKLWLAGHYFDKIKRNSVEDYFDDPNATLILSRASEIYGSVFNESEEAISPETEAELIKYVSLLSIPNKVDDRLMLLVRLVDAQDEQSELEWKFRRQALYELASCYESKRDHTSALEFYKLISQEAGEVNTPLVCASQLKAAQIEFNLLNASEKSEKNESVLTLLNSLKDLQIKKHVDSEPAHLESALAYAQIRAEMAPAERKERRYLFFLVRMKESFQEQSDPIMENYLMALDENASKKELYENYMTFVDAEIARLQASIKLEEGQLEDAKALKTKAQELYNGLTKNKKMIPELKARLVVAMKSFEQEK